MNKGLVATSKTEINASVEDVWKALTTPAIIKQYLFGTETTTDWKLGSPIRFKGSWEGKEYEDKGTILEVQPKKLLRYTYWSSMAGKPDVPENYATVSYELNHKSGVTVLTIVQDNNASPESKEHSEKNWGTVLSSLKKIVESAKK